MSYNLVFSSHALESFDAIKSQLREKWGTKTVAEFEKRTLKVLETVSMSPLIFQGVKHSPQIRKGFIHKNCSVFYEVKQNHINILFFWDNRQEPIW
jgi:plasmid stabilization system protein ParE